MNEEQVTEFAERITTPETELLKKISRETHLYVMHPRMLSGHVKGALLQMLSRMIKPGRILEIGMYTGYSAICLASGLKPGGELITIEHDPELEKRASAYFREAGLTGCIRIMTGEATEIIPALSGEFDLVFMDADKRDYPQIYKAVMPKLSQGGFIIADNVLWGGKIFREAAGADKDTRGIREFNEMVKNDERTENVFMPFHDGIMLIRKK